MSLRETIENKLNVTFKPDFLNVVDESGQHNVPPGTESHFKVIMVSSRFDKKPNVKRHRMVNETLSEELATHIHALSLKLWTPDQWVSAGHKIDSVSPPCMHR